MNSKPIALQALASRSVPHRFPQHIPVEKKKIILCIRVPTQWKK